jgi:hemoglobin
MIQRNLTYRVILLMAAILILGCQTAFAQSEAGQEQKSLYDRLGGLAPISVVVDDFIDTLVPDQFLNENPAIDAARRRVPAPYLKYHVIAMVCEATGGPCRYMAGE